MTPIIAVTAMHSSTMRPNSAPPIVDVISKSKIRQGASPYRLARASP